MNEFDDWMVSAIADVLLERRRELGISQADMAASCGLNRTYISDIERGRRNLTLKTLVRLSGALAMSASDFMRLVEGRQQLIGQNIEDD